MKKQIVSVASDSVAVLVMALRAIGQAISMAALIFGGALAVGLPRAASTFVVAAGLHALVVGWRSTFIPAASVMQDGPAIVIVAVAATVGVQGEIASVVDVFSLLATITLATGIVMWVLGRFGFGTLVRYMPTTVVGAFLAGTGWLLVKGGLDVMVGFDVGLTHLGDLLSWNLAKLWVPGFLLGLLARFIGRSDRMPSIAVGAIIMGAIGLFYAVVLARSSLATIEAQGWLIGPFPDGAGPSLVLPSELADTNWRRILSAVPGIFGVVAVSVIVLLLNLTGLGAHRKQRLNVDAELQTAGIANMALSPLGASPAFHGVGTTLLLDRIGAKRRVVPIVGGVVLVAFGIFGVGILQLVPRLVVGSLLVTVGGDLLYDWFVDLRRSVQRVEQALSVGIVLVIAWVGILEGIGAGLVAACAVFITRYSRIDPIRSISSGKEMRSSVDRPPAQAELLQGIAGRLLVAPLQGYLFFGSVASIEDRFDFTTATTGADPGIDAIVLDFGSVTGIDTSAYSLVGDVIGGAADAGISVIVSALDADLRGALVEAVPELSAQVTWAETLDLALEVAEESQLQRSGLAARALDNALVIPSSVTAVFESVSFAAGDVVVQNDAASDGLMIVTTGSLSAFLVYDDGRRKRLGRFGSGSLVGEIGLVTGMRRTALVLADTDVTGEWLSLEQYENLREHDPETVYAVHELIMQVQARRVVSLSEGFARWSL